MTVGATNSSFSPRAYAASIAAVALGARSPTPDHDCLMAGRVAAGRHHADAGQDLTLAVGPALGPPVANELELRLDVARDEPRVVAEGDLPLGSLGDDRGAREGPPAVGGEEAAGMVEVQVRQHDDVDLLVAETGRLQVRQQHVIGFDHAKALPQLRLEEGTDAGFEQHRLAVERAGQQRAASELDAVAFVRRRPLLPHRPRRVAEHRATVELLRVAEDGPEFHRPILTPRPVKPALSR